MSLTLIMVTKLTLIMVTTVRIYCSDCQSMMCFYCREFGLLTDPHFFLDAEYG